MTGDSGRPSQVRRDAPGNMMSTVIQVKMKNSNHSANHWYSNCQPCDASHVYRVS